MGERHGRMARARTSQVRGVSMKIVKQLAIVAVISTAMWAAKAMGMSDLQVGGIFALIAFIWLTQQIDQLKTASGKGLRDDHQQVIKEIEDGKPIEPKHNPPASIEQDEFESFIRDEERTMFRDFGTFGEYVNNQLQGEGWRLQELPKPHLERYYDSPGGFGRQYTIHFNALNVGRLKVCADILNGYSTEAPHVIADTKLSYLPFFQYGEARGFLEQLNQCLAIDNPQTFSRNSAAVEHAMTAYLWELVREPDLAPDFELRLEGQPVWYLRGDDNEEADREARPFAQMLQDGSEGDRVR